MNSRRMKINMIPLEENIKNLVTKRAGNIHYLVADGLFEEVMYRLSILPVSQYSNMSDENFIVTVEIPGTVGGMHENWSLDNIPIYGREIVELIQQEDAAVSMLSNYEFVRNYSRWYYGVA